MSEQIQQSIAHITRLQAEITPLTWSMAFSATGHRLLWHRSVRSTVAKVFCEFDAEYVLACANAMPALLAYIKELEGCTNA